MVLRLRFVVAMFLGVAGCDSVLGLGDFTDQEDVAPSGSSGNAGGGATSASMGVGQAGGSLGGNGASGAEGGGGHGGTPASDKTVFVTGASFNPLDIASVGNANSLCQAAANAAGLGGTYRAWLSDNATTAAANVNGPGPWYRLDGAPVFATAADLLAQNSAPTSPIVITELFFQLPTTDRVWTGTLEGGDRGKVCTSGSDDWVSGTALFGTSGVVGDAANWTNVAEESCDSAYHIYCFEL